MESDVRHAQQTFTWLREGRDNEMVWNTVCEDLPALQSQVKEVSSQIMD
jgi:uncharacterized protein with HEPN domain